MSAAMPGADRRPAQGGFTLLEVLVALVVLGFLMVGLTQAVRSGVALHHAQRHRLAKTADLDSAMRLLRRVFTRLPVNPSTHRLLAAPDGTAFNGGADRVSFVGDLPNGVGTTGRAEMTLSVEGGRLVLSWRSHRHARLLGPPPPLTRTILLDHVKQLQLAYWGSPAGNGDPTWRPRWQGVQAPQLIRIRIRFEKGDPRRWPDLIAAARL